VRIAHLTPVYPPYPAGAGVACAYQADALASRGHDVTVYTVAGAGPPPPSRARVVRLPALLQLGAAPLLPGLFRLPPHDVIHVHHPFIFGVEPALLATARRPRPALVVAYHNRLIGEGIRAPLFWGYEETLGRALARRANRLLVLSEPHAETIGYLRAERRRDPAKLAVVPNGVDTARFRPGPERDPAVRAGLPPDAVVAVHVNTLDRVHFLKRTDLALAAAAAVPDERLHLVIVGDGEWRARLEGSDAARALGRRVRFLGHRDHDALPAALRAADLFLLSSDLDAFPLVLLEALATGLPAVSTDPPGVRAMLAGSEAALVAPAGDARALAAHLGALVGEAGERRRRGGAARSLVLDSYALPRVVDRLEAVYREAVMQVVR